MFILIFASWMTFIAPPALAGHHFFLGAERTEKVETDANFLPFSIYGMTAGYDFVFHEAPDWSLGLGLQGVFQKRSEAQEDYQSISFWPQIRLAGLFKLWGMPSEIYSRLGIGYLWQDSRNQKISGEEQTAMQGPGHTTSFGLEFFPWPSTSFFIEGLFRRVYPQKNRLTFLGEEVDTPGTANFSDFGLGIGVALSFSSLTP